MLVWMTRSVMMICCLVLLAQGSLFSSAPSAVSLKTAAAPHMQSFFVTHKHSHRDEADLFDGSDLAHQHRSDRGELEHTPVLLAAAARVVVAENLLTAHLKRESPLLGVFVNPLEKPPPAGFAA